MDRLTLKIKSQLAVLMAGVLLFNSIPALNMLVYAQEDGSVTVLSDSVSDGDVSGGDVSGGDVSGGDVSGGDVSGGDVSGGDADTAPPEFTEVIYKGSLRVENEQGDVIEIIKGSVNNIDETMHVFTKEEVELDYKLTVENPDDMQYIKVLHVINGIYEEITGAVWSQSENNTKEWNTSISVSGQGKHRIEVEYQKDDISVKNFSAPIYIDDTEAKLNKVKYSVSSGDSVEVIPEGDLLERDITRYYKENVKVEFELAENFFYKSDLKISDSYYEGSGKTLQYSTSTENGMTKVICEILAEDEGTHELSFSYYDKIYNKNVSYNIKIIIDTTPAEKWGVKYSPWVTAEDKHQVLVGDIENRNDLTLYYKDNPEDTNDNNVEVTFSIKEANFHKEGVSVSENGVTDTDISWSVEHEENDIYSVKCCIPKSQEGDHVIILSYQDRCGNGTPITVKSNTIRIDSQKSNFTVKYTDWTSAWSETGDEEILQYAGGTRDDVILYHKESMTLTFEITEEHFRGDDVEFSDAYNSEINNEVLDWKLVDAEKYVWQAQYTISEKRDHKVSLSYQDRSGNKPSIKYVSERIVLDDTPSSLLDVTLTPCVQEADGNLYYSDKVDMTFTIEEENFNVGDVVLRDNEKEMADKLNWKPGTGENSNLRTATYTIPKEKAGKHVVALEYKDRFGNEPIEYTSEPIIIDVQKPEIILGNNEPKPDETEEKKIIYCGEGQKIRLCIKEENFRASDVDAAVSGGGEVAGIVENAIDAQVQDSSNWTKEPEGYVSYIDLGTVGEYDIVFNYKDLARNAAEEESALIIVDVAPPKVVGVSYDTDLCKRMVGRNNETVTTADADTRFIYQEPMTFELTIEEEHFDAALAEVSVYRDGIKLENNDGYNVSWTTADAKLPYHTLSVGLGEKDEKVLDGDYRVIVDCKDPIPNSMESYTSNIITIDKTNPKIAVDYNNKNAKKGIYYNKERVAAITVTDRNVVPGEIEVNVTGKDIDGIVLPYDLDVKQSPWSPGKEQGTWISTITYDMDANYEFEIKCRDMATNNSYKSDKFTVDKTAPDKESFKIEYSTPIMEASEGTLQNTFYKDSVTVKITAKDRISPIDSFEWTYMRQPEASSVNQKSEIQVINNKDVEFTYDAAKGAATAEFTLTADQVKQYRGNVCFRATDMAGNTSEKLTDNERIVIVDNISPSRTVEYSPASHIVNKDTLDTLGEFDYASENVRDLLLYNAPMTITFKVNEANFYANDIVIKVNDTAKSVTNWSKDGDVWTGSLDIAEDGEYIVTLQYTDRSTNKMVDYVSHTIIVDTIKPKIHVNYSSENAKQVIDGTKYYDKGQTATITIEERNFRADDVQAVVKATDINGNRIDVQDFAAYLKNRNNWVTQGDKHTAKITFEKDANYEFDIDFKDLALISADDYPKDVFTVDQTAPTNVKVSYSSPVSQRTILGTEYEFYKDPIVVTITAEDEVSGVYSFDYSYVRAAGVSSVNSENINKKVEIQDIKYSDGRKTATATFVIPASALRSGTQINGNMEFAANNRSMLTTEYKDSRRYVVDSIVPDVTVELNESVQKMNDVSYYAENINVTVSVDEANFYKEDVKVSISKDGGEQYAAGVSWRTISADRHIGSITLEEEGNYKVFVSYQDPSTNKIEDYESNLLIIDKTRPSVSVAGIKHNSANNQEQIGLVVTVEDTNLNTNSFQPKLLAEIRDESGNIRQVDCTELGTIETVTVGKSYTYTIPNINQDGIYQLSCLVSDMSGNATDNMMIEDSNQQAIMQLNYSVNRNGSTYSLGEGTKKLINQFVKKAVDVVVYETNPDEISNIKITLFKNDETIILEDGVDYTVNRVSDDGDWYKYEYTIYDTNFEDDGTYRISIYSEDKAGNIAENNLDVKDVEISFGVDKTLPNLIVTNLESKTTYPVDKLSVLMRATDNMKLQDISVEMDGEEIASWDEEQIQEMSNNLQDFVFDISGDETNAHNMIITLTDIAGNQRIESISDFYVTRNLWVRFINNKILFYGSIITCLTTGLVIILLGRRKWKRNRFTRGENH